MQDLGVLIVYDSRTFASSLRQKRPAEYDLSHTLSLSHKKYNTHIVIESLAYYQIWMLRTLLIRFFGQYI